MKGKFNLERKFDKLSIENIFISEITLAELKYGVANSEKAEKNKKALENFLTGVQILPIFHSLDLYASEKSRLKKAGTPIDDFDLFIGVTSINHKMILVTNNTKHFERLEGIELEDWTN